jgi:hypothetical protein
MITVRKFLPFANTVLIDHVLGFDLRPFLYPTNFPWQFKKIDEVAAASLDRSSQDSNVKL